MLHDPADANVAVAAARETYARHTAAEAQGTRGSGTRATRAAAVAEAAGQRRTISSSAIPARSWCGRKCWDGCGAGCQLQTHSKDRSSSQNGENRNAKQTTTVHSKHLALRQQQHYGTRRITLPQEHGYTPPSARATSPWAAAAPSNRRTPCSHLLAMFPRVQYKDNKQTPKLRSFTVRGFVRHLSLSHTCAASCVSSSTGAATPVRLQQQAISQSYPGKASRGGVCNKCACSASHSMRRRCETDSRAAPRQTPSSRPQC